MNGIGMFEFMLELFTPPDPALVKQRQQLVQFLDVNLDPQIKRLLQQFSN